MSGYWSTGLLTLVLLPTRFVILNNLPQLPQLVLFHILVLDHLLQGLNQMTFLKIYVMSGSILLYLIGALT